MSGAETVLQVNENALLQYCLLTLLRKKKGYDEMILHRTKKKLGYIKKYITLLPQTFCCFMYNVSKNYFYAIIRGLGYCSQCSKALK